MAKAVLAGLRLAVGTLTVLPVGPVGEITRPVAALAMLSAPVAALPLGLGTAGIVWAAKTLGLPSLLGGALVVGLLGLASRGMHLDGLSDTVDGFAAGWSRERALEIMRKGDVGPLGAAAVCVVVLADASVFGALSATAGGWLLAGWAVLASRGACAALTVRGLPAARPGGLGAAVADTVPRWALVVLFVVLAMSGALVAAAAGVAMWQPVLGVLTLAGVAGWLGWRAARVLGGVTGDIVGAGVELGLVGLLGVLAIGLAG